LGQTQHGFYDAADDADPDLLHRYYGAPAGEAEFHPSTGAGAEPLPSNSDSGSESPPSSGSDSEAGSSDDTESSGDSDSGGGNSDSDEGDDGSSEATTAQMLMQAV